MRSNQLSYPAIILLSGCKGTTFLETTKIFRENIFYFADFSYFCGVDIPLTNNKRTKTRMGKQRIDIEYPLTTKSPNIIWEQISSAHGLERWLADHVKEENGIFTFTWGEPWTQQDIRQAHLIESVKHDHIRLKWDYDDDTDSESYWEMRIGKSDLTHYLTLFITDFAEDDDADGLKILWESNLDRLHRASGL